VRTDGRVAADFGGIARARRPALLLVNPVNVARDGVGAVAVAADCQYVVSPTCFAWSWKGEMLRMERRDLRSDQVEEGIATAVSGAGLRIVVRVRKDRIPMMSGRRARWASLQNGIGAVHKRARVAMWRRRARRPS